MPHHPGDAIDVTPCWSRYEISLPVLEIHMDIRPCLFRSLNTLNMPEINSMGYSKSAPDFAKQEHKKKVTMAAP